VTRQKECEVKDSWSASIMFQTWIFRKEFRVVFKDKLIIDFWWGNNIKYDQLAVIFCRQVAAWVLDVFSYICI
jgi:hypothetical protein